MPIFSLQDLDPSVPAKACPDCGVMPGEKHRADERGSCDVSRCKGCGWQLLQCIMTGAHYNDPDIDPEEVPIEPCVWTGEWPGEAEARALDIWIRWGPPWIKCDASHPDAVADLNGLVRMHAQGLLRWDRDAERLVGT